MLFKKMKPIHGCLMLMGLSLPVLSQANINGLDYQDIAVCDEFGDIYSSEKSCVAIVTDRAGNMFTTPPTKELVERLGIKQAEYPRVIGPAVDKKDTYIGIINEGSEEYSASFVTFLSGVKVPGTVDYVTGKHDFHAAANWCSVLASNKFGGVDNWQVPSTSEYLGVLGVFTSLDSRWPKQQNYVSRSAYEDEQNMYRPGDNFFIHIYDFKSHRIPTNIKESIHGYYVSCMAPAKEAEIVVQDTLELGKIQVNKEYTAVFKPKSGSEGGFEGKTIMWGLDGDWTSTDVSLNVDITHKDGVVASDAASIKFRANKTGTFEIHGWYYPEEGESYIVSDMDIYRYKQYGQDSYGQNSVFLDRVILTLEVIENLAEYEIASQQELNDIAANSYILEDIFVNADTVVIRTSDGNWVEKLALPDDLSLSDGKELRFVRDAGWSTELTFDNKSLVLNRYTEVLLRYTDGKFQQVYDNLISEDDSLIVDDASVLQWVSENPAVLGNILADSANVLIVASDGDLSHLKILDDLVVNEGQELIVLRQGETSVKVSFNNRSIDLDRNESLKLKYTAGQFKLITSDVIRLNQVSPNFSHMTHLSDSSVFIYIPEQESVVSSSGLRDSSQEIWEYKKGVTTFSANVKDGHGKSHTVDIIGYKKNDDSRYAIENAVLPGYGSFVFGVDRDTLAYQQLDDGRYSGQIKLIVQEWDNQAYQKEVTLDLDFVK